MARMTLIDINMNDELPTVIRKCNDNFRRMSSQQAKATGQSVRLEGERSDAALADAMGKVEEAMSSLRKEVEEAISGLRTWVEGRLSDLTKPKLFAPPIGTYLYCEQDPADTWSGTVWEQQPEGLYLVSADLGDEGTVGANSYTLATEQMPQHSHTGPSHTHGVGTLATESTGAHTHTHSTPALNYATTQSTSAYPFTIGSQVNTWKQFVTNSAGAHTHSLTGSTGSAGTGSTGTAGGSAEIDNRPLSAKVPLWKRTA